MKRKPSCAPSTRRFPAAPLQPIEVAPFAPDRTKSWAVVDNYLTPCLLAGVIFQRMVAPRIGQTTDEAKVAAALPKVRHCLGEIARLAGDREFLADDTVTLADLMADPANLLLQEIPLRLGRRFSVELPALGAIGPAHGMAAKPAGDAPARL